MRTASNTRTPARPRTRRGTIIILAVGLLAVLAVAALGYMTITRQDRSSAAAYANIANYRQQAEATVSHIRGLLTADLFGNKLVTTTTPKEKNGVRIWPKMFEDGEYWDYPAVDSSWLDNPTDPDPPNLMYSAAADEWRRRHDERTPTDDAWLASQQPIDAKESDGHWDTWPQITNLRSAWLWQPQDNFSPADGYWRRDHGRYVDLAEFLANSQNDPFTNTLRRGSPGIDISRFDLNESGFIGNYAENNTYNNGLPTGPNLGVDAEHLAGPSGVGTIGTDLRVFEGQTSRVQEMFVGDLPDFSALNTDAMSTFVENIDERLWADTDGDRRPDARWQELDVLGELFGLRWVVAARIVDNSARINVNSSLEWQFPGDKDDVGAGRTPADIDLYRLLRRSVRTDNDPVTGRPIGHPDTLANTPLDLDQLKFHWDYNRREGLKLERLFDELNERNSTTVGWTDLEHDGSPALDEDEPLARREREDFWSAVGAAPQRRADTAAGVEDEIDLRAHEGVNSVILSEVERRFDQVYTGMDPMGYLPGMVDPNSGTVLNYPDLNSLGPLRSREQRSVVQTFGVDAIVPENDFTSVYFQGEKLPRLQTDIRRHLTTVSGVSDLSPIPPVNDDDVYVNRKIQISDPEAIRDQFLDVGALAGFREQVGAYVNRAFGAFMWALAPLGADQVITEGLVSDDMNTNMASNDADHHYGGGGADRPADAMMALNIEYPLLRAASLAVNLADALDRDADDKESPTIAHFNPPPPGTGGISNQPSIPARVVQLQRSFSHGRIPNVALNSDIVGTNGAGAMLIGLDRQPFLTEVVAISGFQHPSDAVGQPTTVPEMDQPMINPDDPTTDLGSMLLVELANPWPEAVNVEDYVIRISEGQTTELKFRLGDLADPMAYPSNPTEAVIQPGESMIFVFEHQNGSVNPADWSTFVIRWIEANLEMDTDLERANGRLAFVDPGQASLPAQLRANQFMGFGINPNSVQLIYQEPGGGEEYLVDRLTPNDLTSFPRPNYSGANPIELEPVPTNGLPVNFTGAVFGLGRAIIVLSASRPTDRPAIGGFPAYVVERPNENMGKDWPDGIDFGAFSSSDALGRFQTWRTGPVVPQDKNVEAPPEEQADLSYSARGGGSASSHDIGNPDKGALTNFPSMQLFVPNGPLRSVAELHMLSTLTHTWVGSTWPPTLDDADDPVNGSWRTLSEQLGDDINYLYDGVNPNPYLGVLDPSRYVPGGDLTDPTPNSQTNFLPDSLRVPLANRVFDCFIATHGPDRLAQGKINLNTAPLEVLESLPFFAPESDVEGSMSGSQDLPIAAMNHRGQLVRQYRDLDEAFDPNGGSLARPGLMLGLRDYTDPTTTRPQRGLVNVGELLAMADWTTSGNGVPGGDGMVGTGVGGFDDFMQLGVDGQRNDGAPLSLRYANHDNMGNPGSGGTSSVSDDFSETTPFESRNDYPSPDFDPVDDPEERLALARSALDIASTRSDVFTAWFILRAYDPEQIEAIPTDGVAPANRPMLLDEGMVDIVESPGLEPVYESRWLCVFDRSEVSSPVDRPRILLFVELPLN